MIKMDAAAVHHREVAAHRRLALSRALHRAPSAPPPPLDEQLERLRAEADAYRAQAVLLSAKLARFAHGDCELRRLRERLVDTSDRLDSAVNAICGQQRRASPRP